MKRAFITFKLLNGCVSKVYKLGNEYVVRVLDKKLNDIMAVRTFNDEWEALKYADPRWL